MGRSRRYDNVGFTVCRNRFDGQFTVRGYVDIIPAAFFNAIANRAAIRGWLGDDGADTFICVSVGGCHIRRGYGLRGSICIAINLNL